MKSIFIFIIIILMSMPCSASKGQALKALYQHTVDHSSRLLKDRKQARRLSDKEERAAFNSADTARKRDMAAQTLRTHTGRRDKVKDNFMRVKHELHTKHPKSNLELATKLGLNRNLVNSILKMNHYPTAWKSIRVIQLINVTLDMVQSVTQASSKKLIFKRPVELDLYKDEAAFHKAFKKNIGISFKELKSTLRECAPNCDKEIKTLFLSLDKNYPKVLEDCIAMYGKGD